MKITESQLRKIIKEEISYCLNEKELLKEDIVSKTLLAAMLAGLGVLGAGATISAAEDSKVEQVLKNASPKDIEAVKAELEKLRRCDTPRGVQVPDRATMVADLTNN